MSWGFKTIKGQFIVNYFQFQVIISSKKGHPERCPFRISINVSVDIIYRHEHAKIAHRLRASFSHA